MERKLIEVVRGEKIPAESILSRLGRGPAPEEEELYGLVTRGIASKQIRPGARLKEAALAEQFGVSRARVRRVLRRLADVDIVEFRLNFGALVCRPSPEEAQAVFRTRRVLEAEAVRGAAHHATARQFKAARQFLAKERAAFLASQNGLIELTSNFHTMLAEMSGNPVLRRLLDGLIHRCVLIQSLYERVGQATICLTDEHVRILDGIESGRVDEAVSQMDHHLDHIEASLDYSSAIDKRLSKAIA